MKSRVSTTSRFTGWATVTCGGGGGTNLLPGAQPQNDAALVAAKQAIRKAPSRRRGGTYTSINALQVKDAGTLDAAAIKSSQFAPQEGGQPAPLVCPSGRL